MIALNYHTKHPKRISSIERLYLNTKDKDTLEHKELLINYQYDDNGNLIKVINPVGTTLRQFAYNAAYKLTQHTLPTGSKRYYDWALFDIPNERIPKNLRAPQPNQEWRVIKHWGDEGQEYWFKHDLNKGETWITDNLGQEDYYQWDMFHHITYHKDPLGGEWHYQWHEVKSIDPLGRTQIINYFEHRSLPTKIIDYMGNHWSYQYDRLGNLLTTTDPKKQTQNYSYDTRGFPTQIIDTTQKTKYLRWNEYGQLTQYTDCSGQNSYYHYNPQGYIANFINAKSEKTQYEYNSVGYLNQVTLADGRIEQYPHNNVGLLTSYIDPAKNQTQYLYDATGKVIQRIDAQGRPVSFHYDAYERLTKLTNENNESYQFEWDALDRLTLQKDLDQSTKQYHYDATNNIIGVDYIPSPLTDIRKKPAANDDATTLNPPEHPPTLISHRFERDAAERLIKKMTSDGITEYQYDNNDNLLSITFTDTQGNKQQLAYQYDKLNQLISETNSQGTLSYQYDELGNLEQIQLPDQRTLNHLYYGSGHLHQINLNGRIICDFERDNLHQEILRTQGQLKTRLLYDRTERLTEKQIHFSQSQIQQHPLLAKHYSYDEADNLIIEKFTQNQRGTKTHLNQIEQLGEKIVKEPHGLEKEQPLSRSSFIIGQLSGNDAANTNGTQRMIEQLSTITNSFTATRYYNYDSTGRIQQSYLNTAQGQGLNYQILHYDAAANLLNGDTSQGYVKYNRLYVYQDKRYSYDQFGRLAEKRIGCHTLQIFKYDAEHRLIAIEQTERTQTKHIRFKYDPLGRRIEKTTYLARNPETPIAKTEFYWQGMRLLGENQNGLNSLYIYQTPESYEPIARIDGEIGKEKISYFHTNVAGLPEQLTDQVGNTIWQAEYEIWGNAREEWHTNTSNFKQNLRYQGQYLDRETGLHYNTFRYYDPDIGRFTQPDPIGLFGGHNLYQYAPNPISWIDPWGFKCTPQQLAQNRANGKAWEQNVTQTAQNKYGANNVHEQVYIRPLDANGKPVNYRVIADNVITPANSPIKVVDAKASTTAPYTQNQRNGYPLISQNGGIIESGPLAGTIINPTTVT